jgi:hypothetical protein
MAVKLKSRLTFVVEQRDRQVILTDNLTMKSEPIRTERRRQVDEISGLRFCLVTENDNNGDSI